jgi:hypothetical protein
VEATSRKGLEPGCCGVLDSPKAACSAATSLSAVIVSALYEDLELANLTGLRAFNNRPQGSEAIKPINTLRALMGLMHPTGQF